MQTSKATFASGHRPVPLLRLPTPVLTVDLDALEHNVGTMAGWCRAAGVDLAPHGKTTMSPDIWRRQLDAGSWGITVATAFQAAVAREAGVRNVVLAGTTFHEEALVALAADPGSTRVLMWVDSTEAVRLADEALARAAARASSSVEAAAGLDADADAGLDADADAGAASGAGASGPAVPPLAVLVEIGSPVGRTGARTVAEALAVVDAVVASPHLVLAGVTGYEGALTHDVDPAGIQLVDDYLRTVLELLDAIDPAAFEPWLAGGGDVVVSAGGSVYFERVVAVLAERHDPAGTRGRRTRVVLRSGSYVAHDHDLYRRLTPFARDTTPPIDGVTGRESFLPAIGLWASVISRPEPELALLNVGRRDTADDEGLPLPLDAWRPTAGGGADDTSATRLDGVLEGAVVTALNDQHAFLRLGASSELAVGDLVRLGVSHPCTTLSQWRELSLVRGGTASREQPPVVEGTWLTRF
ncbi:alanine racemase [Frigoribacterium sp. PvP032]|uniref:alanine racemase n=1 Tax=Frigoribacterium sp. PvP032 TaxID=2806589 RepID=UPI001B4DB77E|nr:alanine racemase [Frigoribacterium sp. PvP032]MBP1191824.1 D-serine deaminase-like pyridoxal phosphate-dependent protein [Frigoribacterium sp. PvP032]